MNKVSEFPDWVLKYKIPGHTIKLKSNGYALYSCTSTYVKGGKPKSVQKYLGMITEEDGFIPKEVEPSQREFLEFGLSHLIFKNFRRSIARSLFNCTYDRVKLSIIQFIFGTVNEYSLTHSFLTDSDADNLLDYYSKISPARVHSGVVCIENLLHTAVPDPIDYSCLVNGLRMVVIEKNHPQSHASQIPNHLLAIIQKAGLSYEY